MKRGLKAIPVQSIIADPIVTTVSPMKRGLKALQELTEDGRQNVTTVSPMKRGLKDSHKVTDPCIRDCEVTTVSPMKRGLKAVTASCSRHRSFSYNRFPDEKGTESWFGGGSRLPLRKSYNRFPDEKGTESTIAQFQEWRQMSYNRFPDEKGTERKRVAAPPPSIMKVTTVSPMKRGLKVLAGGGHRIGEFVTTVSPMKRGLKDQ